jgi:DNA helicase-2/ATP-dependent DNA helicase PcrA
MATPSIEDLVAGLNDAQEEAVKTLEGPVLIVAGPGSGKTRVLTHRVGALLSTGTPPWRILAVTFTNKAAGEMRERLDRLVGEVAKDLWVSTFHSLCVKLLRRYSTYVGLEPGFTILDQDDATKIMKAAVLVCGGAAEDTKKMMRLVSYAKNNLMAASDMEDAPAKLGAVAKEYEDRKTRAGVVDFDDLLTLVWRLCGNEEVAKELRAKFSYVLVDEYQDTNRVQYEILRALTWESRNLCVVGDSDQCLLPGTLVKTPGGSVAIEFLKENDEVLGTRGTLDLAECTVRTVKEGTYSGPVIEAHVGKNTIVGTPQHLVPARFEGTPGEYYVYLMYRADRGYRVGRTKGVRTGNYKNKPGFIVRMNQENADCMWILRVCTSIAEASYYESYYAATYGLPTACFHSNGRDMAMKADDLIRLYSELDTEGPAKRLMDDLLLHPEFPHVVPQSGTRRHRVLLTMFSDRRGSRPLHRISWTSNDSRRIAAARRAGFSVRDGKKGFTGVRVETVRADYRDALELALGLSVVAEARLQRRMLVGEHCYTLMPLANLHRGMRVLVASGSKLKDVPVSSVTHKEYSGPVYDLEVAKAHNYVAGGLLVHNSVYAFRGAFPGVLEGFLQDYGEAKKIKLGQNYRSTKRVVALAAAIIAGNPTQERADLWTENDAGELVRLVSIGDDREEAAWVVADVAKREGSTAVIVRTNAQTKPFEDALMSARVSFQLVGAQRFFDRAEVRDTMAWLRGALNPGDYLALTRAAGAPKRGLGEKTLAEWFELANQRGVSPLALARDEDALAVLSTRGARLVAEFAGDVERVATAAMGGPEAAIKAVISVGLLREMERERQENVNQLLSSAEDFMGTEKGSFEMTQEFVESIALTGSADAGVSESATAPLFLITAHAAKGREFDNVYVVGVEEGIYPHAKAEDELSVQEERRLLFVAASRARTHLTLSWCGRRNRFGKYEDAYPSPFLEGLEEHVSEIRVESTRRAEWAGTPRYSPGPKQKFVPAPGGFRFAPESQRVAAIAVDSSLYPVGAWVVHPRFGRGQILTSGDNVKVRFSDQTRVLALAYAKLEVEKDL